MAAGTGHRRLLDHAEHTAQPYRERCQDTPLYTLSVYWAGELAKSRGQVKTAARWCRQVVARSQGGDPGGMSFTGLVGLTGALGMAGDAVAARQAAVELIAAKDPDFVGMGESDLLLAQAWVAAAEGSVSEAVTRARQAAEVAASQHQDALEVLALHTAVCFGDRTVAGRLAELAHQIDGPRAPAAAAHAAALAADDGAALLAASAQLEKMGALLLLAADAAAAAAAAHSRHREIVSLAAGGLSNRAIAERLVVSVRTVEGHLYRACAKLGAADRTELATLLHTP